MTEQCPSHREGVGKQRSRIGTKKNVGRNASVTLTEFTFCKYLSIFLVLIKSQIIAFIYSPLSGAV